MTLLVLASHNQNKCRELAAGLEFWGITLHTAAEMGFNENISENGQTFLANARHKATVVSQALNLPALADDSGLCVEALGGRPGVFSARYAGPQADDQANNQKLLASLAGLPPEQRQAAFICVLVCRRPDGRELTAQGELKGRIALAPSGRQGFGYDPLMELPSRNYATVASLSPAEKNAISHRAQALHQLAPRLPGFLGAD